MDYPPTNELALRSSAVSSLGSRTAPHNLEAERAALGGVMIKPSSFDEMATVLVADDFYLPAHREIFEALLELDKRRQTLDPIALAETVLRVPPWELVGWLQRWSYDLLLARIAGRIRYHVNHEGLITDTSRSCKAADIAAYLRRLTQARSLARHPLNAKLFVEDLLLQYQRLIRS